MMKSTGKIRINTDERIDIKYGLQYLKGNSAPYFSITCDIYDNRGEYIGGGAAHDIILKARPDFAPLMVLRLSDHEGVPMHCIANGLYYLTEGGSVDIVKRGEDPFQVAAEHFRMTIEWVKELDALETKELKIEKIKLLHPMYKAQADMVMTMFELEIPKFPSDKYVNPLA